MPNQHVPSKQVKSTDSAVKSAVFGNGKVSSQPNKKATGKKTTKKNKTTARASKSVHAYRTHEPAQPLKEFRDAGGVTGNTGEVIMDITRLIDLTLTGSGTESPIFSIGLNLLGNLFGWPDSDFGEAINMLRVLEFELFAAPMTSLGSTVANRFFSIVFGVPVKGNDGVTLLAAQQTTILKPNYNIDWVRVGGWKAKDLFSETTQQPSIVTGDTHSVMQLGEVSALDPDDGTYATCDIQLMYRVRVAQPVPLINQVSTSETMGAKWLAAVGSPAGRYALIEPKGIANMS